MTGLSFFSHIKRVESDYSSKIELHNPPRLKVLLFLMYFLFALVVYLLDPSNFITGNWVLPVIFAAFLPFINLYRRVIFDKSDGSIGTLTLDTIMFGLNLNNRKINYGQIHYIKLTKRVARPVRSINSYVIPRVSIQLSSNSQDQFEKNNQRLEIVIAPSSLETCYEVASVFASILSKKIYWELASPPFFDMDISKLYKMEGLEYNNNNTNNNNTHISGFVGSVSNPSIHNIHARQFIFDDADRAYPLFVFLYFFIAGILFIIIGFSSGNLSGNETVFPILGLIICFYFIYIIYASKKTVIEIDGNSLRIGWKLSKIIRLKNYRTDDLHAIFPEQIYRGRQRLVILVGDRLLSIGRIPKKGNASLSASSIVAVAQKNINY